MIQQYIHHLAVLKGYATNTAQAYEKDLKDFARWAKANVTGARWSTLTRADIDRYISACVGAGLKPATTNRRLAAISGLYRYMKREGLLQENPAQYESRRKRGEAVPNTIPTQELQAAYEHSAGVVKVMLGLLASTGIRIQELLDISWENIDFGKNAIKVHGKGNKERIVYTTSEMLATLKAVHDNGNVSGHIFTQSQREARRMIWEALKPWSNAPQLSPHAIRHTFATHMAAQGVNCSTLQGILGHKNLVTTQHYIDLGQTQAQQACIQYALLH